MRTLDLTDLFNMKHDVAPELKPALDEIQAVLTKYDLTGMVQVCSPGQYTWDCQLATSWNSLQQDHEGTFLSIKADEFPSPEACTQIVTLSIEALMKLRWLADNAAATVERFLIRQGQIIEREGPPIKAELAQFLKEIRQKFMGDPAYPIDATCFFFEVPNQEARDYALDLYARCLKAIEEQPDWTERKTTGIPAELFDVEDNGAWFRLEATSEPGFLEQNTLWFSCAEGYGPNAMARFIQHLLAKFDPNGFARFEWGRYLVNGPDAPTGEGRSGCFSGGVCLVTATERKFVTTEFLLLKSARELEAEGMTNRAVID